MSVTEMYPLRATLVVIFKVFIKGAERDLQDKLRAEGFGSFITEANTPTLMKATKLLTMPDLENLVQPPHSHDTWLESVSLQFSGIKLPNEYWHRHRKANLPVRPCTCKFEPDKEEMTIYLPLPQEIRGFQEKVAQDFVRLKEVAMTYIHGDNGTRAAAKLRCPKEIYLAIANLLPNFGLRYPKTFSQHA